MNENNNQTPPNPNNQVGPEEVKQPSSVEPVRSVGVEIPTSAASQPPSVDPQKVTTQPAAPGDAQKSTADQPASGDPQKPAGPKVDIKVNPAMLEQQRILNEDVDFVSDSRAALVARTTPYAQWMIYCLGIFLIASLFWLRLSKIDEITRGMGKVVPFSQVQIIQNLEGGILASLNVSEGQLVKKQQILAKLDDTLFTSQYGQSYAKYLTLQASIARLQAELGNQETINFSEAVKIGNPKLVEQETKTFNIKTTLFRNSLANLNNSLKLAKQQLEITQPLAQQGVMSKIELIRIQREVTDLQTRIDSFKDNFYAEEAAALDRDQNEATVVAENLSALKDRLNRTIIYSPMDGIVKKIYVNTLGGVVKPAEPIMEIVPLHDKLIIEALVQPSDIAFVKVGQKATVKITAYDYSIYGGLNGVVTNIGADTNTDQRGNSFYEVTVETDKSYLGKKVDSLPIMPGMTAMIDIITGKKPVLTYVLKPILRAKEKALRERKFIEIDVQT